MRVLMIGDIVGRPGRKAVKENLPELLGQVDLVVANAENASGGLGLTKETAKKLLDYGIDIITMGNHVWNKKELLEYIASEARIIRPANYPPGVPGRGWQVVKAKNGMPLAVANLSGRVFMEILDCPFRKADEILGEINDLTNIVLLDFHAEATSEKAAMGWYLDGRVSAVCGTHTHVQTADERILPGGTAFITDVGMTGPRDSIIGFKTEIILEKFTTMVPRRFEVAKGLYQFNAVILEIDDTTGKSLSIQRIQNLE